MRFRVLRWIRSDATTGTRQFREVVVQARQLTIGRGSDRHLQIADPKVYPHHALIRAGRGREGAVVVEALTPGGVIVNGRNRIVSTLNPGDEIRVGPAVLIVEPAPKGAPFTLRFRMAEQENGRLDRLHVLSLSDSGLSKRFWSLMLASGVAAIFLIVPMAAALYSPLRPLLRASSIVPNDALWSPGPLHAAHRFIGGDCNACHTLPFAPVENVQCTNCHTKVEHHVRATSADSALFDRKRCTECHVEHAETPTLVSRDQRLCTDCHSDLASRSPKTRLLNVADFGLDHPDFRVNVLQAREGPDGGVDWTNVRLDVLPGMPRFERSRLSFSHAQHLARKGIKGPDGEEVLDCKSCHVPDSSGRLMLPIQMEKHCSRCHSLRFDENDPATTVPHGDIDGVYRTLLSHFSRRFLEGGAGTRRASSFARRPGGEAETISRDEQSRARDWAGKQSLIAARDLFEKRVCVDCHEVTKLPDRPGIEQWKVELVKLTQTWMPSARFDHESHKTSECAVCHAGARSSARSGDVLMPAISDCRVCHAGANEKDKLPSDCLMCHQFHLPGRGLFDPQAGPASLEATRNGIITRMRTAP
ncbi:MAG: cytochrome c3 family protein [Gammaproteobacteria bacterium]